MAHDMTATFFPGPTRRTASSGETPSFLTFHQGKEQGLVDRLRHLFTRRLYNVRSATPSPEYALDIRSLSFSYGRKNVLQDVSLAVRPGQICGLLGPNGSGKSTLFRCCMGFLHPEKGRIHVHGVNIAHMKPSELARHVAYVPQEHKQPFPFVVRDMVLMGRSPHMEGWFRIGRTYTAAADQAMQRIGITALADTACNQLSGGQRQLVLIARAMAQQTPLILLDEPTSALDFSNQLAVWKVLREVAEQGVAILVCCHDPNHILWFCDTAAVLSGGRVFSSGPVHTTVTEDILQHIYGPECVRISTETMDMVCPRRP